MDVVGHNDRSMQLIAGIVIMKARLQDDVSCNLGQYPSAMTDEGDEVRFIVALQVREFASMKHTWGRPPSAVRRSEVR